MPTSDQFLNPARAQFTTAPVTNTPAPAVNGSEGLDPKVITMAKAIRQTESGGDFNAVGDQGTSKGAYQFHNDHFEKWAKQFGLDPADFSPGNQNHLAYLKIKQLKDEGRQPDEIAAIWNGAKLVGNKYVPVNPAYVQKVKANYDKIAAASGVLPGDNAPAMPPTNADDPENKIVNDDPLAGVGGFLHGLVEPELKGAASAVRAIQATPKLLKEVKSFDPRTWTYQPQGSEEVLNKPLLGQKTGPGSSVDENLGSAATAGLQLAGLKLPQIASAVKTNGAKGLLAKLIPKSAIGKIGAGLLLNKILSNATHKDLLKYLLDL